MANAVICRLFYKFNYSLPAYSDKRRKFFSLFFHATAFAPFIIQQRTLFPTSIKPKLALDFSEHDILSGARTSRRQRGKNFPLVKKIISDIF